MSSKFPKSQYRIPALSPKDPGVRRGGWQLYKFQGIESRHQRELPSIGKEIPIKGWSEILGQLGFSLAQTQGDSYDDLLRFLLRSGWLSRLSTVSTRSHVGPLPILGFQWFGWCQGRCWSCWSQGKKLYDCHGPPPPLQSHHE